MLESLIKGVVDVNVLSGMAKGRMKNKTEELKKALTGMVGSHQRMIIAEMLKHIDSLKESIQRLDTEVKERMRPFEEEVASLDSIVGVGEERVFRIDYIQVYGKSVTKYRKCSGICKQSIRFKK